MPVTLTIKNVPDKLAEELRLRAAARHRSLQGELMSLLEEAIARPIMRVEAEAVTYRAKGPMKRPREKSIAAHGKRLTLPEVWERSRRLGPRSESESTKIVRTLRDARYGR